MEAEAFSPNKVLRREQLAVVLDRMLSKAGKEMVEGQEAYEDDAEISDWAKESVYRTAELFERTGEYDPREYVSYDELEKVFAKVREL